MQAVKIKLYQNMVNFRREMSYGYIQTYPLPTPSMVRGMVHEILDLKEYSPLKVSIQGSFDSVATNMQRIIKFDRDPKARPTNPFHIVVGQSQKTATTGVMFVDSIVNLDLLLHISFEDSEKNEKLLKALMKKPVILGRNEDLANLDFKYLKITNVDKVQENKDLKYHIYLSPQLCKNEQINGTYYRLPFCYESVLSLEDKRIFKFVDAVYVSKGGKISEESDIFVDEEGEVVNFLSVS